MPSLTSFHMYAGKDAASLPPPIVTLAVHSAARPSEGWAYVISLAFLNSPGVPSQSPSRQTALAVDGSPVIVRLCREVTAPAVTFTDAVCTASSPLWTVIVYVPGSIPLQEKAPVPVAAFAQYCASALAKPTVYGYAESMPFRPTPATLPRPAAPTQPVIPRPSTQPVSSLSWKSADDGAPPSVKERTYGPWRPKRSASVCASL